MTFSIEKNRLDTLRKRKIQQILVGYGNSFRKFECEPVITPLSYTEAEAQLLTLFDDL